MCDQSQSRVEINVTGMANMSVDRYMSSADEKTGSAGEAAVSNDVSPIGHKSLGQSLDLVVQVGCSSNDMSCESKASGNLDNEDQDSTASVSSKDVCVDVKNFIEEPQEHLPLSMEQRSRLPEKLVFMVSVASVILMAYALVVVQWLLPYYYAVSAPLLIGLRICLYIRLKFQYFLMDFCYFGNTALLLYLWFAPNHSTLFLVMFGIANGPLAWATIIFRNSLVFHDIDKMTSVYIHMLPVFLTYGIRWYADVLSRHWYTRFNIDVNVPLFDKFGWLVLIPFVFFAVHYILYLVFVYGIFRPDHSYLNSFRYLSSKDTWQSRMLNLCGARYRFLTYSVFNWLYCACSLLLTLLLYQYFIVHTVFVILISLIVVWNAAVFYVDVFSVRGFRIEV